MKWRASAFSIRNPVATDSQFQHNLYPGAPVLCPLPDNFLLTAAPLAQSLHRWNHLQETDTCALPRAHQTGTLINSDLLGDWGTTCSTWIKFPRKGFSSVLLYTWLLYTWQKSLNKHTMVLHILKRTDSTKHVARAPGYLSGTLSAACRMMSDREPDN